MKILSKREILRRSETLYKYGIVIELLLIPVIVGWIVAL